MMLSKFETVKQPWQFLLLCLISFFLLYLIYSPTLQISFLHHDIYHFSVGGAAKSCMQDDYGLKNMLLLNRPIAAGMDCFVFKYANSIYGVTLVRWACLLMLSLAAVILAKSLYYAADSIEPWVGLLLSISILSLPGMQTTMLMAASFISFSVLCAVSATMVAHLAYAKYDSNARRKVTVKSAVLLTLALALLLLAFFAYPAVTGVYLLPCFFSLLLRPQSKWLEVRRNIIRDVCLYSICLLIYFLVGKIVQAVFISGDFATSYLFKPNLELLQRIKPLFVVYPSLWSIHLDNYLQMLLVYGFTVLSLFYLAKKSASQPLKMVGRYGQPLVMLLGLLMFGAVPYLLQPYNMVFTRILFGFQSMTLLLFFWLLLNLFQCQSKRIAVNASALSLIFLVIGGLVANNTVAQSALNDFAELNYLTALMDQTLASNSKSIKRLHFVGQAYLSPLNFNGKKQRDDIFNINSAVYRQDSYFMVVEALNQLHMNLPTFNCALDEYQLKVLSESDCIKQAPKDHIVVTYSRLGEQVKATPGTFYLDMSHDIQSSKLKGHLYAG